MKRSNRLVLLVGVFLAIVAFVGILVLSRGSGSEGGGTVKPPTTGPVVIATTDIPLSTRIRADQLKVETLNLTAILPGAYTDISQVVGEIVRDPVATGAQITKETVGKTSSGTVIDVQTPAGFRAIAVRVDQTSGVGTVIKTGDYVDSIIALNEDEFASVVPDKENPGVLTVTNPGPKGTTVKLILQGMQVLGTLLPPVAPPETTGGASPAPSAAPGTPLNEQEEIVILAVTAQQAEVIRYAQTVSDKPDAPLIKLSLILRSPDDFIDPVTGQPVPPVIAETTGIVLRILIDEYGVLPPTIVQPVLPVLVLPTPRP